MTPNQIKDIAVSAVEGFINHNIPLSEGIAKQAEAANLNEDMIKRAVEATNNIAYLKLLESSRDRTFEFPLANISDVISHVTIPENLTGVEIAPSEMDKSAAEATHTYEPTDLEKVAMLRKAALRNHQNLQNTEIEKAGMTAKLLQKRAELSKDKYVVEKLAEVCDEDSFGLMVNFVLNKEASTVKLEKVIFKEAQLNSVRELLSLYKQAKELVSQHEKAASLDKKAFLGALLGGGAGALARGAGSAVYGAGKLTAHTGLAAGKAISKASGGVLGGAMNVANAASAEVQPAKNIWDNLQGKYKRY